MWQPLETAPKDRPILLFEPGLPGHLPEGPLMMVCQWVNYVHGSGAWEAMGISGYEFDNDMQNPTHWMELPEAPK